MQLETKKITKNTIMLYGLTIAKMVFPLITLPYLTRILSVSGYGIVSYVKAVMQYMQLTVDFGFMLSGTKDIALAGQDKNQINKEVGNILVARIMISVLALAILSFLISIVPILHDNKLFTLLSFIPVFLTIFLMDFYFRGIEKMEIITIRFIIMKGLSAALTFVFVHSDNDILWIPILDIVGSLIAVILVWLELKKNDVCILPEGIRKSYIKLKESAIYFFSDIATTAFNALNTLLIGIYISPKEVAFWSLCMQLVGAVQSLYTPITSSIYPQMIKTKSRKLIQKTARLVMPIVISGCILTFFLAKYALLVVGGEKYIEAEFLLRLLIPVLLFSFPCFLFGWPTLGAIGKQKETTVTTVASATFQIVFLIILIWTKRFNLFNVAIARDFTEAFFFAYRYILYKKYSSEFV